MNHAQKYLAQANRHIAETTRTDTRSSPRLTARMRSGRHRLGVTPRGITAWFSPTADGVRAFPLVWNFPRPEAGNPVTIEARPDAIIINIWGGAPIHGIYDGTNETWTIFNQGFYRIVATK